jgi:CHAD domain-containing protein
MRRTSADPLLKESRLLGKLSKTPTTGQIHGFRTTSRRIEALLASVFDEPGKNERKLLKQLGRVRRRAGRVRDVDVQMKNLQELHLGREGQCRQQVLQHLKAKRKKAVRRLVESLDGRTLTRLRKRLRRTSGRISELRSGGSPAQSIASKTPRARAFLAVRLQKLQTELPLSEQTVHDYRLRCKRLRYTLELSDDTEAPQLIAQLKDVQDVIGKWHDSVVLLETAQAVIDHPGSCPLVSALRNLSKAQLWQALQVTRGILAGLTGSERKPAQGNAESAVATAVSA